MNNSLTPEKNSTLSFVSLILLFCLSLIFISGFFSYVLVEARTSFYLDDIEDVKTICTLSSVQPKFVKVLDYNRVKKFAKVYCGYSNASNNRILELNYTNEWKIILDIKVNKEGAVHWPIYL